MEPHPPYWIASLGAFPARTEEDRLDRALLTGLLLEVILEDTNWPRCPQARRRRHKIRLQETVVRSLAGRISLDRFRGLALKLEGCFAHYYPLLAGAGSLHSELPKASPIAQSSTAAGNKTERLGEVLATIPELSSRRRHRKMDRQRLEHFLLATQGGWFRLKEVQDHFGVDRKTAWEYLHRLLGAQVLVHNGGRSSAVRYALNPEWLAVKGE